MYSFRDMRVELERRERGLPTNFPVGNRGRQPIPISRKYEDADDSDDDIGKVRCGDKLVGIYKHLVTLPVADDSDDDMGEIRCSDDPLGNYQLLTSPADHRGWVLIIVNYEFDINPDKRRLPTLPRGNEIEKLTDLFKKYKYNVRPFENLNKRDILKKIHYYASKPNSNSFICMIASHGNVHSVSCSDGSGVDFRELYEKANTKNMKNKPKCFFFDTCRGEGNVNMDNFPAIPADDFFVGLSCLVRESSSTGDEFASVYLGHIHKIFCESFAFPSMSGDKRRDLHYLISKVHRNVMREKGQKPECQSSLYKTLYLQGET